MFDWSNNNGSIDVKMGGSILEEKSSFKMLGLTFSSKLDWSSYIVSVAKTAFKKIEALIHPRSFFLLRLLCISINLPYNTEYCCQVWAGVPSCHLELLDRLQKLCKLRQVFSLIKLTNKKILQISQKNGIFDKIKNLTIFWPASLQAFTIT